MIKVLNLCKSFDGFQALHNVNVTVPKGSVYGIVGPNGSGKTTLIKHMVGILIPDQGTIKIDENEVKADYQNMSNEKMVRSQVLRYGEGDIGNFTLAIERSNLPQTNRFRDGRSTYGISVYYENTFRLLQDKGYITEDVYNFVNIHREMLDEKYSNQTVRRIVSIAYL